MFSLPVASRVHSSVLCGLTPLRRHLYKDMAHNSTSGIICDVRSDTVTRPSAGMYEAMVSAPVGDDVFREDQTTIELERRLADLCGHEAGLFCASGTMSNQLAMRTHLRPLESAVIDHRGHVLVYEAGGVAYHAQGSLYPLVPLPGKNHITADLVERNIIKAGDVHEVPTRVVCMENTLLGMVLPLEEIKKICAVAEKHSLVTHLDGARLWNASVATGVTFQEYGKYFDSISLCLSKGMGAPIGSVLVGRRDFIERARHFRKVFGGGWRQSGVLAAACHYAIDHNWQKIANDHQNAKYVAGKLTDLGFKLANPADTNMVWADCSALNFTAQEWAQELKSKGILIGSKSPHVARLVIHFQAPREALDKLLEATQHFVHRKQT